jgi:hypothetical protein
VHVDTHTLVRVCIHTCTHTHTLTHTHARTRAHTHTLTHTVTSEKEVDSGHSLRLLSNPFFEAGEEGEEEEGEEEGEEEEGDEEEEEVEGVCRTGKWCYRACARGCTLMCIVTTCSTCTI